MGGCANTQHEGGPNGNPQSERGKTTPARNLAVTTNDGLETIVQME